MKRFIAIAMGIAATSALAQAPASPAKPDAGFFRPTDLAAPPVPLVVTQPGAAQTAPPQPAAPDPGDEIRKAEEMRRTEVQMDRIELENERGREQAPVPITGAFTGLTSERDR